MSSQADDFYPISFQKSIISGNLNSTLLFQFLSGLSWPYAAYVTIKETL